MVKWFLIGGFLIGGFLGWAVENLERSHGHQSWDYDGKTVDFAHAAIWGALAVAFDSLRQKASD